ncbi:hypothetical protein Nepgr_019008 [Nepenthes gracilis]|uniref:Uncharacterized protein n=1 Tax=Nepenthes gracilis TaxID=150966 RepID=A0AAD3SU79_NEPGR|nr:hypothetical protein Nepgr_019008 [Nepenthes gracilis]
MNGYRDNNSKNPRCSFHPKEEFVGVCPLCLKQRLLILAAKQGRNHHHHSQHQAARKAHSSNGGADLQRKPSFTLHKILAPGSLFQSRKTQYLDDDDDDDKDTANFEDSFISIKFEENGIASWEKAKVSKASMEQSDKSRGGENLTAKEASYKTTSIVQHEKRHHSIKWKKWIGQFFQLIKCRS